MLIIDRTVYCGKPECLVAMCSASSDGNTIPWRLACNGWHSSLVLDEPRESYPNNLRGNRQGKRLTGGNLHSLTCKITDLIVLLYSFLAMASSVVNCVERISVMHLCAFHW